MAPPSGTIDLGELPPHDEVRLEPGPWWPGARFRRWRDRRTWQLAGAAAVTALIGVTVTAAAAPPGPALTRQFTVAGTWGTYDEQTLYVIDGEDETGTGPGTVTAYRLADGTVRWETSPPGARSSWLTIMEGTLLVVSEPAVVDGTPGAQTTRLDPDTGKPLWTHDGWPERVVGQWLVLERELTVPDPEEPFEDVVPMYELTVVDHRTGAVAWRTELTGAIFATAAGGTSMMTRDAHGELRSYDLATGELLATASLAGPDEHRPGRYYVEMPVIDSVVVVMDQAEETVTLNAFDAATLAPSWSSAEAASANAPLRWPVPCGELVCLNGADHPPRAVDPLTGAQVWSADWLLPDDGDPYLYEVIDLSATHPEQLGRHLVLTRWQESRSDGTSWLVEAGTGAPVLDLTGWSIVGRYGEGPATPAPIVTAEEGRVLWIGRLRPDLSGVDVLGAIDIGARDENSYPPQCGVQGDYAVCHFDPMGGGRQMTIEVWRLGS